MTCIISMLELALPLVRTLIGYSFFHYKSEGVMYSSKAIIGQLQNIYLCKQCLTALALEKRRL